MEAIHPRETPSLIDLSTVEEAQRATLWVNVAPSLFPGLSINRLEMDVPIGDIRRVWMGGGTLWTIRSPAASAAYLPDHSLPAGQQSFTLLMQVRGGTDVAQKHHNCTLDAGDICLLDEQAPFRLDTYAFGEILFLRMPRDVVLSRNPSLEHQTAITMVGLDAGVSLLTGTLSSAMLAVPFLRESQRRAALTAIIHLLGAVDTPPHQTAPLSWRVQAALSYIDLHFVMHSLCADQVAQSQRISRRRLDQLLREAIGVSITGQIWNRRLEQSAADLRDPDRASCTASQIAFANGFEDAAHFTRAFKRRYGHSPLQWRNLGLQRRQ